MNSRSYHVLEEDALNVREPHISVFKEGTWVIKHKPKARMWTNYKEDCFGHGAEYEISYWTVAKGTKKS